MLDIKVTCNCVCVEHCNLLTAFIALSLLVRSASQQLRLRNWTPGICFAIIFYHLHIFTTLINLNSIPGINAWTINELKKRRGKPGCYTKSPTTRTIFSQYQASGMLGWPVDGDLYLVHKMQSGGWPSKYIVASRMWRLFVQLSFEIVVMIQVIVIITCCWCMHAQII